MRSGSDIRESQPQPTVDFRFGEPGEAGPKVGGAQLPGELPHLAGELELPLGAHFPEALDLELPNLRIHLFHDRNLTDPKGPTERLPAFTRRPGTRLVAHPGVDKIAFTGSGEVGKRVMRSLDEKAIGWC